MRREELARRVSERALLHGDFVLRSGKRSTVYLDKYRFETDPALLGPIGAALAELAAQGAPPDRLAGPELGAVPLAAAAALASGIPFLIVRKAPKDYATEGLIEGVFEPGERVLAIEDVVTTGGALIAAVEVLRAAGLAIERALCVLDREEGGGEALAALGVQLEPLFRRADLGMPVA
ncbi:MAG: orotate phosphoribosyltransferase [Actinomycetota bacterium]|nr:orotate phosphoribosyltransferase [Actinomycetota bacterium]